MTSEPEQEPGNLGTPERLRQRRSPQQRRGRAAFDRILRATGELLDEVGYDGVTTLNIAERAGVNIATLYRYFPNKLAVLRALAERLDGARAEAVAVALAGMSTGGDWRATIHFAVAETARLRAAQPGGRALRRALQSSPELWQVDHDQTVRVAGGLAARLCELRPALDAGVAHDVALVVVTTVTALLDLGNAPEIDQDRILAQMQAMLEGYLARYLD
ncbi:helix-turn-helix domain-containing protein [Speluncibacter jeojiensis]|uniref:TetR/AcrR family transcriptional regulator n=1 Tax=Speluncibacter jeojiensis TaxID=2710754 RepID=A0A9X4RC56_9ACTN|nr:TetR/AcrR family transcriptional regulator [Corynebacteriales bacterium D3-21]